MNLYTKIVDGKSFIMPSNKIVLVKDDMQVFNPTEAMLLEDGWKIYEQEFVEPSAEEILTHEIDNIVNDILIYDSSENVNMFYLNDIPMWLDRDERTILQRRFELEIKNNIMTSTLWKNDNRFEINPSVGIQMLDELEMYAIKCFDATNTHLNNVKQLKNLDDVKMYDYKVGYPDKLIFKL